MNVLINEKQPRVTKAQRNIRWIEKLVKLKFAKQRLLYIKYNKRKYVQLFEKYQRKVINLQIKRIL